MFLGKLGQVWGNVETSMEKVWKSHPKFQEKNYERSACPGSAGRNNFIDLLLDVFPLTDQLQGDQLPRLIFCSLAKSPGRSQVFPAAFPIQGWGNLSRIPGDGARMGKALLAPEPRPRFPGRVSRRDSYFTGIY